MDRWKLISLEQIHSNRKGTLTPVYNDFHVPFKIKRVYYLYDTPAGSERGGHAHKNLQQLIVAASGSFEVTLINSKDKETITLNRPNIGLYVPRMVWRELKNFSSGSICLVLASDLYAESDYYREFSEFMKNTKKEVDNL